MKAVIVAPGGGPTNERRDALWAYARPKWERMGRVFVGEIDDPSMTADTYNRGEAINDAAELATEAEPNWDHIIVIDRDVIVPRAQVGQALTLASESGRATLPFRTYHPLTMADTDKVLAGGAPSTAAQTPPGIMTNHESSCVVVPRKLWESVGGFDIRFVGWGGEDRAFLAACRVLGGGLERVDGRVYHLWHEPTGGPTSPNYRANRRLQQMYLDAKTPEQMQDVIAGLV